MFGAQGKMVGIWTARQMQNVASEAEQHRRAARQGQPARTNRATSAVLANQIICHISLSEQDTNVSDTFSIL